MLSENKIFFNSLSGVHHISLGEQTLWLHPAKCAFWEEKKILLIADIHLGKGQHFTRNGIPLPEAADFSNLILLQEMIDLFSPHRILFLGDLFHSGLNESWDALCDFVSLHAAVAFSLIKGNHDILSPEDYSRAGLEIIPDTCFLHPFTLVHEYTGQRGPVISGHIHPGVKLHGKGRQSLRLPCFQLRNQHLLMPAFGTMTGLHIITPQKGDRVFVVTGEEVIDKTF